MALSVWFWVVYVLGLFFGLWSYRVAGQPYPWERGGAHFITWILLGILGLGVFGGPVK